VCVCVCVCLGGWGAGVTLYKTAILNIEEPTQHTRTGFRVFKAANGQGIAL
jgi:hypothetical protein